MPLLRPDRDLLNQLIDAEQAAGFPLSHGRIGDAVRLDLLDYAAEGDERAPRLIAYLLTEAITKESAARARTIHTYRIAHGAGISTKQGTASLPNRNGSGATTKGY